MKKGIIKNNIIGFLLLLFIVIVVNVLSEFKFFRLDLTAEKRYSISEISTSQLEKLDDIVFLKIYLDGDNLPPGFKRLKTSLKEMLDEFIIYGGDNIQYEFINPNKESDKDKREAIHKELYQRGLVPITLYEKDEEGNNSEKVIFPGIIASYKGRELAIDLLSNNPLKSQAENLNNSVSQLEYNLSSTIENLQKEYIPTIGFTTDHGELSNANTYSIKKALSDFYNVQNVAINENLSSLSERKELDSNKIRFRNKYELLFIAKPTKAFSEKDKFILDQFIMHGGRIVWLIDGTTANMDSQAHSSSSMALPINLNLNDQFFNYGVRINNDLIQDLLCAKIPAKPVYSGKGRSQLVPFDWLYFPLINPTINHEITNNLDMIFSQFASSIDTVHPDPLIKKTILLTTSKYTKTIESPLRVSLDLLNIIPDKNFFTKQNVPIAVMLEGSFRSNFLNRVPVAIKSSPLIDFKGESSDTKMMFISDGEIIKNPTKTINGKEMPYPTGYDIYSQITYANKDFSADYLLGNSGTIYLRNRQITLRLLDKTKITESGNTWKIINTAIPVILIIFFGIIINFIRKRRFTK